MGAIRGDRLRRHHAKLATRPRLVVDEDGIGVGTAHFFAHAPRERIGRAPRRKTHNDAQGLDSRLGPGKHGAEAEDAGGSNALDQLAAGFYGWDLLDRQRVNYG